MQTQAQFINLLKSLFQHTLETEIYSETQFSLYIDKPITFKQMEGLYLSCKKYNYTFLTCAEEERFEILTTKSMTASAA